MNTLLFTGFNDAYAPLAKLTIPLMAAYCNRQGYAFDYYTEPLQDIPNGIYWTGVLGSLQALRGELGTQYDRVFYLDVDQMITNPDCILGPDWGEESFLSPHGLHVSTDWGADATEHWHFSACGIVAHKDCIPLFEEILGMEPEWRDKPFPEQGPMREAVRKRSDYLHFTDIGSGDQKWNAAINVHPRRFLNAVPKEVDPTVQEPWQPGDFAAHLTNLPLDKRIELFHEIRKQAGI